MQTLKLRNCFKLVSLPKCLRKLINLRHLEADVASLQGKQENTMGIEGTLEYFSDLMSSGHKHKKKTFQIVELKVRMDCDGCELKVRKALSSMSGVKSVDINRKQQKVIVSGYVEANKVLKKAKSTGKKAEIWPYVPYNLVAHPYTAQAYDKRAPPGYVRNIEITTTGTFTLQLRLQRNEVIALVNPLNRLSESMTFVHEMEPAIEKTVKDRVSAHSGETSTWKRLLKSVIGPQ
ncbi:hypothetical protein IFM89_034957 [Coptis chinensis]|uniref:HMA domain-containing protein n=1 Tax=Coptis chinensis TaxID=261450 RepID=A0A835MGR2_9MAGN|nr:hypothetical protein IFM89_034957 [Coptis chinensis]